MRLKIPEDRYPYRPRRTAHGKGQGVNIYPGQIEDVLKLIEGVSSEYQVMIDHLNGKDIMTLFFETNPGFEAKGVEKSVMHTFKEKIRAHHSTESRSHRRPAQK